MCLTNNDLINDYEHDCLEYVIHKNLHTNYLKPQNGSSEDYYGLRKSVDPFVIREPTAEDRYFLDETSIALIEKARYTMREFICTLYNGHGMRALCKHYNCKSSGLLEHLRSDAHDAIASCDLVMLKGLLMNIYMVENQLYLGLRLSRSAKLDYMSRIKLIESRHYKPEFGPIQYEFEGWIIFRRKEVRV